MPRHLHKFFYVAIFFLSACAIEPQQPFVSDLTFEQIPVLTLPVARIDIEMPQVTDIVPNDASFDVPQPPAAAVNKLLQHQLVASGMGNDVLKVRVERADVIKRSLQPRADFVGFFSYDPVAAYDFQVRVVFELSQENPSRLASARVAGNRHVTITEAMSIAEQDSALFKATENLMNEVANSIDDVVKRNFLF